MEHTKICTKCNVKYPATTDYFHKEKNGKYGVRATCKECTNLRHRTYCQDPEKANRKRNNNIAYYADNAEHIRKYSREYSKGYYKNNREKCLDRTRRWYQDNPSVATLYSQKRRSSEKKVLSTLTKGQWMKIKNDFSYRCAYCGMTESNHLIKFGERLHQDHFIPLSKGGEYTHNNIIPACRSCNASKSNNDFFEWYPQYAHYDKTREGFILNYLGWIEAKLQQLSII